MKSFLLVAANPKSSFGINARTARTAFRRKYGVAPNTFYVHPTQARRDYHIAGVNILRKQTIMPNTLGVARTEPTH